jgi:molybdopterin-containing oxidoreductase family membrane subunit
LIFLFGKEQLLFWLPAEEGEHLSPWLNAQFLLIRNLAAQLVFYAIAFTYFLMGLMPDVTSEHTNTGSPLRRWFYRWVLSLKAGRDEARLKANMYLWAPVILICCVIANTFVAWDFGMMLVPHYHSSVYAMLFIHGSSFGGSAAVLLAGVLLMRVAGGREFFGVDQLRCMGILLTGFALFWIYLFWAQFFVTWFGNLPREYEVIWAKMYGHYAPYFWIMMICLTAIPIGSLIFARTKRMWWSMIALSSIIVVGTWINRYLMVLPALEDEHVPFSAWQELVLVTGLIAGFLFALLLLVRAIPMISNWEIQDAGSERPAY